MFKNVVQLAYVTTDLERAVAVFRDDQGVREFATFDSLQLPTVGGGQTVINWGLTMSTTFSSRLFSRCTARSTSIEPFCPSDQTSSSLVVITSPVSCTAQTGTTR